MVTTSIVPADHIRPPHTRHRLAVYSHWPNEDHVLLHSPSLLAALLTVHSFRSKTPDYWPRSLAREVVGCYPGSYIPDGDRAWLCYRAIQGSRCSQVPGSCGRVGYPRAGRIHAAELSMDRALPNLYRRLVRCRISCPVP